MRNLSVPAVQEALLFALCKDNNPSESLCLTRGACSRGGRFQSGPRCLSERADRALSGELPPCASGIDYGDSAAQFQRDSHARAATCDDATVVVACGSSTRMAGWRCARWPTVDALRLGQRLPVLSGTPRARRPAGRTGATLSAAGPEAIPPAGVPASSPMSSGIRRIWWPAGFESVPSAPVPGWGENRPVGRNYSLAPITSAGLPARETRAEIIVAARARQAATATMPA